jgi:hypothetical protein
MLKGYMHIQSPFSDRMISKRGGEGEWEGRVEPNIAAIVLRSEAEYFT